MNLTLWMIAGLLAVIFVVGSVSGLTMPKEKLAAAVGGEWVEDFSAAPSRPLEPSTSWVRRA